MSQETKMEMLFYFAWSQSYEIEIQSCINYENTRVYPVRALSVQGIALVIYLENRLRNHFLRMWYVNADVWFESSFWYTDSSLGVQHLL